MRVNFFKSVRVLFMVLILGLWMGCSVEPPLAEPVKDINGSWKIVKVVRNTVDITKNVKVDNFQLDFQVDSSDASLPGGGAGEYHITRGAPFVVNKDGKWKLNNPAFPFTISFSPESDPDENIELAFSYLVIGGKYQIKLVLQPGCPSNTYEYYLSKVN